MSYCSFIIAEVWHDAVNWHVYIVTARVRSTSVCSGSSYSGDWSFCRWLLHDFESDSRPLFLSLIISTLSSCMHAVVALLYPFSWQHTFIPVLPGSMLDIVCCPTPFLVGLLSNSMPKLKELPVEEVSAAHSLLPLSSFFFSLLSSPLFTFQTDVCYIVSKSLILSFSDWILSLDVCPGWKVTA